MVNTRIHFYYYLFWGILIMVLPLPEWAYWLRPDVVLLLIIYGALYTPWCGMLTAWCMGLVVDILIGDMLGQHALIYSIIIFLVVSYRMRLNLFKETQRLCCLFFLLVMAQSALLIPQIIQGNFYGNILLQGAMGVLLWKSTMLKISKILPNTSSV